MIFTVILSELATHDLISIEDWLVERAGAEIAANYIDRIVAQIRALDVFPNRGTPRNDLKPDVRSLGFERRITILYAVQHDVVQILRVIHTTRDLAGLLD